MEVQFSKNNNITGISITYNEKEGAHIMELKRFFNYQIQQIRVRTSDGRYAFVNLMDTYYIESLDGRCLLYDKDQIYFALDRFQSYKNSLKEHGFVQCNKTQLVNINHIKEIEIYKECQRILTLDNDEILLVSRRYKNNLDEYKQDIHPFLVK